ncbi:MAG TPA: glycosyltransferase [Chloroflexi bacterium]|nr:glycosyltransferase [Chloroflexota bacterium]
MRIVILGLSITSSWGNGHATTYRGLVRALTAWGHDVLFLERYMPWYAAHRDLPDPPYGQTILYSHLDELFDTYADEVRHADLVIVGSYVPEGVAVGEWVNDIAHGVTAFYDIDTPVTLAALERGQQTYISTALIPRYQIYLSFTGGPVLDLLVRRYGAPVARPLYCAVDPEVHYPEEREPCWDLGYMGTYSADRQPALDRLLMQPARSWPEGHFVVAGPQYPESIEWPDNVQRIEHLPPVEHRGFYNRQRYTLNITRRDMIRLGYAPSVRLFEAAACRTPIISDYWEGLDQFFQIGREILIAQSRADIYYYLRDVAEPQRMALAERARQRVLNEHTSAHRAAQLESYLAELRRMPAGTVPDGAGAHR